jgi:signal peptidase I
MRPMIKKGDRLAIRPVQPGRVRIGDIVVFETGEELCAHRLIRKHYVNNRHIFITKSDKALEADPPFTHESLVGKISHIYSAKAALNLESAVWKAANLMLGLLHMFASSSVDTLRYCKRNLSKSLANV